MKDLFEYSTPELVRMLGTRFKEYRMRCSLTQKEVSELSGVGLTTYTSLKMARQAIFHCRHLFSC